MNAERQCKVQLTMVPQSGKTGVRGAFLDNRPRAATQNDMIHLICQRKSYECGHTTPGRMYTSMGLLSHLQNLSGNGVLQRVLKIGQEPIRSLEDLRDYVNIDNIKSKVREAEALSGVSDEEINNSIRSLNLELQSGRDLIKHNEEILVANLIRELGENISSRAIAKAELEETNLKEYPEVINAILLKIDAKESIRLKGLICVLWESGQISAQKIIEILQEPLLTNEYRIVIMETLTFLQSSVSLKILGSMPVRDIVKSLQDGVLLRNIQKQEGILEDTAGRYGIDLLDVVEVVHDERFDKGEDRKANLTADLSIVSQDQDYNLQADMSYIRMLEERFNRTVPKTDHSPSDHDILSKELSRMKRIYAYKINYITIVRSMKDRCDKAIEVLTAEIRELKKKHDQVQYPVFRQRATEGYRMRKTRDAINERKKYLTEIESKEHKIKNRSIKELDPEFSEKAAAFLQVGTEYMDLMETGAMLLPGDMRLAGIFPKSKSVTITKDCKRHRHLTLYNHARKLIMEHGLFKQPQGTRGKGFLSGARIGCVCIMYVKEGKIGSREGASYRPFFGASGVDPYGKKGEARSNHEVEELSYTNMGLPSIVGDDSDYQDAVSALEKHIGEMKQLGIKPPSLQSQLYYLQVPEYKFNRKRIDSKLKTKHMLEPWMPSNCAEPAIMTAIFQLYHRPSDIYLSVPFEGELYKGKLLLKYTCARCAASEPAFMSPVLFSKDPRFTDMRRREEQKYIDKQLQAPDLIYNATNREHPYLSKSEGITEALQQAGSKGFAHLKCNHD